MQELTFILDDLRGKIVVEDNEHLDAETLRILENHLGEAQEIACARPLEILLPPPTVSIKDFAEKQFVRIAGFYHNSLTEGPGRRSSVLFQFCPLKCKGCYVPQLHSNEAGELISVEKLTDLLLDSNFERDGVTILGGEPFAQPEGLNALVKKLRSKSCPHIVCYSGYTLETLRENAETQTAIGKVLNEIDILIDGAYVESFSSGASLWTGSGNQRVIDLVETRKSGRTILYRS